MADQSLPRFCRNSECVGLKIPKVRAMFLPPAPSFLSRANRCLSTRSRCIRSAALSYSCPLKERPSSEGRFCVDSHRSCLAAAVRGHGGWMDDLTRVESSFEGTRLVNDMVSIGFENNYIWSRKWETGKERLGDIRSCEAVDMRRMKNVVLQFLSRCSFELSPHLQSGAISSDIIPRTLYRRFQQNPL